MNGPDAPNWEAACRAEMDSLGRHEAADPVPEDTLPTWDRAKRRASEVVHTFWVLKNKYVNGTCEKYKARLVFDGRMQKSAVFNSTGTIMDTFSPTTRHVTHKALLAQSSEQGGPSVTLSAEAYIDRLVAKYLPKPLSQYPTYKTPCDPHLLKHYEAAVAQRRTCDPTLRTTYAAKCGATIYCLPSCRVDCVFAIGICARCLTFPTPEMNQALDRLIAYLGQTRADGLTFSRSLPASERELHAYSDADWNVAHSTSGYVILLGGSAIAYASKRQHSVAKSSA